MSSPSLLFTPHLSQQVAENLNLSRSNSCRPQSCLIRTILTSTREAPLNMPYTKEKTFGRLTQARYLHSIPVKPPLPHPLVVRGVAIDRFFLHRTWQARRTSQGEIDGRRMVCATSLSLLCSSNEKLDQVLRLFQCWSILYSPCQP